MKMSIVLSSLAVALAVLTPSPGVQAAETAKTITLYKNPQCGCCEGYAAYMREHGYAVTVVPTHDLVDRSQEAGIPEDFQGCHLSLIDGHAVSGHVPVGIVEKLLAERPGVRAISLPGMPAGSPGMNGSKTEPFTVYGFGDGEPRVYAVE